MDARLIVGVALVAAGMLVGIFGTLYFVGSDAAPKDAFSAPDQGPGAGAVGDSATDLQPDQGGATDTRPTLSRPDDAGVTETVSVRESPTREAPRKDEEKSVGSRFVDPYVNRPCGEERRAVDRCDDEPCRKAAAVALRRCAEREAGRHGGGFPRR